MKTSWSLPLLGALALASVPAHGQTIVLADASAYIENFDALSNNSGSTSNSLTLTGWYLTEAGGGARDNERYAVDTGASSTGDVYSYGAAGSTERALGLLQSGTLIPTIGAAFTNGTGSIITDLEVGYTGEQWRLGTAARTDQLSFEYSLDATSLVSGTWTDVASLRFVTPTISLVGAKDGNAAANRTVLSATIAGLALPNGSTMWVRWTDTNATGADDGLAVDEVRVKPTIIPEPAATAVTLGAFAAGLLALRTRRRSA